MGQGGRSQKSVPVYLDVERPIISDRPFSIGAPGFEPGTSASRTQRSTGLSHAPISGGPSRQPDSNRRPQPWQGCALPAELCLRVHLNLPRWAREAALPSRSDLSSEARTRRPATFRAERGQPAELCLRVLRISLPPSHRSELNRRPLDYESSALPLSYGGRSGAGGTRTRDLLSAIQALSQTELRPLAG